MITGPAQVVDNNNAVPASIDVVTLEPEDNNDDDDSPFSVSTRVIHLKHYFSFDIGKCDFRCTRP